MDTAIAFLNLLQMTRAQPQYGYAIAGGTGRIGNLAEHHYLVAMTAWTLSSIAKEAGGTINVEKVLKLCLLHDIGELFGGDISMHYANANPKAKELAKAFEAENQAYLSRFFSDAEMTSLAAEALDSKSDEAHIAKLADYMEATHYKLFTNALHPKDIDMIVPKLQGKAGKINQEAARTALTDFIKTWATKMRSYTSYLDASTEALGV